MSYLVTEAVSGTAFRAVTLGDGSKLPQSVPSTADGTAIATGNPMPVQHQGTITATLAAGAGVVILPGSSAIGSVGVTSLPSLPTGTNAIGSVTVTGTTTVTMAASSRTALKDAAGTDISATNPLPFERKRTDGAGAAVPLKFAKIDAATSGFNTLVAAVAGKKLRVLNYAFMAAGSVNANFASASTALTGAYPLAAQTGVSSSHSEDGVFETIAGDALRLNLSGAIQVSGHLAYIEV